MTGAGLPAGAVPAPGGAPVQLAVVAKAPVPGTVKTRLCPPYTPRQAARLAAASLADVLAAAAAVPAARRVLLLAGTHPAPPGWQVLRQRGDGLGARLANAYQDLARPACGTMILAGDVPQLGPGLLADAARRLARPEVDAVLGLTDDGGFWTLGVREPALGALLHAVPMSRADTGARTLAALSARRARVVLLPVLRDVDTAADAAAVAAAYPHTRFAATVRAIDPAGPDPEGVRRDGAGLSRRS